VRRAVSSILTVGAIGLASLPGALASPAIRDAVAPTVRTARVVRATPAPSLQALPTSAPLSGPGGYSLDMAIGQMMAASFDGPTITPGLRHLILDDKVGTVLIFGDNFSDAASVARLTAQLQELGREAALPAPLLVTVDEEGGEVMRITDGVPPLTDEYDLGLGGPATVRTHVAATAVGLRSLGIALDLAPVADLRTNPYDAVIGDRSYGGDAARVGPLVAAAVAGLHDGAVGATLKHFPGLGGAAGDPHSAIPTDYESMQQWANTQARSFAAGIAAGADAVMTTSVYVPGLDRSGAPALFSKPVVTGLLRERLAFQGVIVTDALGMGGIVARYSLTDAVLLSVEAGNDLLLLGVGDEQAEDQAIQALKAAVVAGRIPLEQVEASAARVVALRERWPGRRYRAPQPSAGPLVQSVSMPATLPEALVY
jgi:beta-N-acetylhexosaminidase